MNTVKLSRIAVACLFAVTLSTNSMASYVLGLQPVTDSQGTSGTVDVLIAFDPPSRSFDNYTILVDFTNNADISFGTPIHNGGAFTAPSVPAALADDFTVNAGGFGADFGVLHSDAAITLGSTPVKLFSVPYTIAPGAIVGATNGLTLQLFEATGLAGGFRNAADDAADGTSLFTSSSSAVTVAVPEPSAWMFLALVGCFASGRSYFKKHWLRIAD